MTSTRKNVVPGETLHNIHYRSFGESLLRKSPLGADLSLSRVAKVSRIVSPCCPPHSLQLIVDPFYGGKKEGGHEEL